MNRFIYLAAIILFCIGFNACEKEDSVESTITSEVNSKFYRHSKAGGDEYKNFVLGVLNQVDDSIPFTGDFVSTYGLPKWDVNLKIKSGDMFAMLVPITNKEMTRINAIYYFALGEEEFEYYLFLNDRDDVAYESMKHSIQVLETQLGLELSNTDFRVKLTENSVDKNSSTKARRNEYVSCRDVYVGTIENPYEHYVETNCTLGTPVMEWYSNRVNRISTGKINVPNPLRGGGGIGNTEPEPDPSPKVLPTPEFKLAKTGCVYDRLMKETSFMKDLLKKFVPVNSKLDLKIEIDGVKVEDELPSNVDGRAYANGARHNPYHNTILIRINKDILTQSPLKIASVIAHELVHAEIYRWLDKTNNGLGQFRVNMLKESHPGLLKEYKDATSGTAQHKFMTKEYVDDLTLLLKWFDRNNHTAAEYNAMAWGGLHETSAFINTQDKAAIKALQTKIKNEEGDCDDI